MNHLYLPNSGRSVYLPSDLSECDYRQYIEMASLIYRYQVGDITYIEFRVQALYKLLDMKKARTSESEDKFGNIYMISQLIDSFFVEDENKNKVIKIDYINNPVSSFRGSFVKYYGPSDEFNNVKFGEYVEGLNHYIDYNETGDPEFLYLLLATFYRKKKRGIRMSKLRDKFDGDIRLPYNAGSVQERAKEFKKQHDGIVFGFYLLFASFQKYMTTAKLYISGNEIDLAVLFDDNPAAKQKNSDLPGLGMKSLLYSFAESGVYGNATAVNETPLWEVLIRMYDLNKRNADFEANQKK